MPSSKHLALTITVGLGATVALALLLLLGVRSAPANALTSYPIGTTGQTAARGFAARSDSSAIHYVATSGSDTGDCTLPTSPCRSVQYAVDQASPGAEVRIAAGVYTDVHVRPSNDPSTTGDVTQVGTEGGGGATNPSIGAYTFAVDGVVPITATPDTGHEFDHWTGDVADANVASTTVPLDEDQEVIAYFVEVPTAAKFASFAAADYLDHALVTWETATEMDTVGFNLQRGGKNIGPLGQVNTTMIPAQHPASIAAEGSPSRSSVSF